MDETLLVFNIDTFRPGFTCTPRYLQHQRYRWLSGAFIGEGKNWSNIQPKDERNYTVAFTAREKEISQYCCTGLYFWRYAKDFIRVFNEYQQTSLKDLDAGEYFIAPMYNQMINEGADIRYSIISPDEVIFCGIPAEYESFIKNN